MNYSDQKRVSGISFFLSYASADDNAYLRQFYKDLNSEVRQLSGSAQVEVKPFERDYVEHATWDPVVEKGLSNCCAFIPLYSPSYFRSLYCGKEFAVFRERLHNYQQQQNLPVDDTLILPVLWNPEDNVLHHLPAVINKIQYVHGSYPNEYRREGASLLVRLGVSSNSKYYNEYFDFIRKFAITIVNAAKRVALPPLTTPLPPLANVTSLFSTTTQEPPSSSDEAGNRSVQNLGDLSRSDTSSRIDSSRVIANSATTLNPTEASDSLTQNRLIFISYRREDTPDISGRIYDSLVLRFGDKAIFKDVDSIPAGVDFRRYLEKQVEQCNVLLAVIGKSWLKKRIGKRRLDNPADFVRIEIASALRREIPVIPLMVNNARMPSEADLPEDLRGLVFRNSIPVRPDPDFHNDMNRLIKELERQD